MAALTQTMTGQSVAPAAGSSPGTPTGEMSLEDLRKQLGSVYDEAEARISAIPGVDYQKMMQPLMDQVQARQVPNPPPWWAGALGALGTGGQTPTIDAALERSHLMEQKKDSDIAKIQEAITTGMIDQEMQKGNFKKALEQSRMLQMLKPITDKYERQIAMKEWGEKQKVLQAGREALVAQKGALQKQLLTQKAREMAKGLGIDDRLLLAQVNNIARQQQIALAHAATMDPLTETWVVNPTDQDSLMADATQQLATWIAAHKNTGGGGAVNPAAPVTPAPTGSPADRIKAAAGR